MKPRVGVSACLVGERVRYDGSHKRQPELLERAAGRVEWVPVCPEAELGLGVPRETIDLERTGGELRLVASQSRRDLTAAMDAWSARRLDELDDLAGFVLKSRSPSCGLGSARVRGTQETADGRFAAAVRTRFPELPVAEEVELAEPAALERFLWRVGYAAELERLLAPGWTPGVLVDFHTEVKLLLMAYSPEAYRDLGRLVADPAARPPDEVARAYRRAFLSAIAGEPSPGRHANALLHAAGYFSDRLAPAERRELTWSVERYRRSGRGLADLKRRLRKLAERFDETYLLRQRYLKEPRP